MRPFRDNRKKLIFNILKEFGQIGRQISSFAIISMPNGVNSTGRYRAFPGNVPEDFRNV
jgi:hypothetical protein